METDLKATQINEGIKKTILVQGTGDEYAKVGQEVEVHYTGTLLDGTKFDSSRDRDELFKFKIGVGQVIKGWDIGMATMKRGEKSLFQITGPYAYGQAGSPPSIPPNATLRFEVEMFDFHDTKLEKWEMTNQQRVDHAEKCKVKGNLFFQQGKLIEAGTQYDEAIDYADIEEDPKAQELLQTSRMNYALVLIKQGDNKKAIEQMNKAITANSKNVKALFRRSQAYTNLGEFETAIADLKTALALQPQNADVKNEIARVEAQKAAQIKQEKSTFSQLFAEDYYSDKAAPVKERQVWHDSKNPRVFFDVKIGDEEPERIEFELYANAVPQTAENFRALCTGEKGEGKSGQPLHFQNSIFHRLIAGFMIQGGDFTKANGTGGESIYGEKFADQNFVIKHTDRGTLSMANAGPGTNASQFFLTFGPTPHLDGKHVVFGQAVQNLQLLDKLEAAPKGEQDQPTKDIIIVDCGEVKN